VQLEELNESLMNHVNTHGRFFLSHTKLNGKFTMRVAIGNLHTTERDIQELWNELQIRLKDVSVI
jgi:aromatic-L-amino-acid decarboxylase